MHLHEYQTKALMAKAKLNVLPSIITKRLDDAISFAKTYDYKVVVKAQIHAGGRGKAGGVVLCSTKEQIQNAFQRLLHKKLVTKQTDADGLAVGQLFIEPAITIKKEFYLSITLDRKSSTPVLIAVQGGGVNVEQESNVLRQKIYFNTLQNFQLQQLATYLGITDKAQLKDTTNKLIGMYNQYDMSLLEVNPLVLTGDDKLVCLDAKSSIDSNAKFRQVELSQQYDQSQQDEKVLHAKQYDLNYIPLSGDIGCMVNGAGLAMATMDLIQSKGGQPANFLDVGGGTDANKVAKAFEIILTDAKVKGILVNIFGGIVKCDVIASGILAAMEKINLTVPLVVRLEGNNQQKGLDLLSNNANIIVESDLDKASSLIVEKVKKC